ncbi:MAG: hypothetical protein ICV60_15280 [Pyrinomonadaceae bacterium]|nr:hypothetical protein [Pyrinomonadaceae bacterium]
MARSRDSGFKPATQTLLSGDAGDVSDYIHNLVSRQLAVASPVKPRLLSMFEPPGHAGAVVFNHQPVNNAALNTEETETESRSPVHSEAQHSREAPPSVRVTPEQPSTVEPESNVWRGQQVAPTSWTATTASETPERETEASPSFDAPTREPSEEPAPTAPHGTDKPAATVRPLSSVTQEGNSQTLPVARETFQQPAPETVRQVKEEVQAIVPRLVETKIEAAVDSTKSGAESKKERPVVESKKSVPAVQPRVITPVENRKEPDRPMPHAEPQASEAQPVINVTIGRIEVRAQLQETPRPRSQPPRQPLMSLEEYLRRRTKGGGT